jgi:hypothetical protein
VQGLKADILQGFRYAAVLAGTSPRDCTAERAALELKRDHG